MNSTINKPVFLFVQPRDVQLMKAAKKCKLHRYPLPAWLWEELFDQNPDNKRMVLIKKRSDSSWYQIDDWGYFIVFYCDDGSICPVSMTINRCYPENCDTRRIWLFYQKRPREPDVLMSVYKIYNVEYHWQVQQFHNLFKSTPSIV